jgi:hypothetical protein
VQIRLGPGSTDSSVFRVQVWLGSGWALPCIPARGLAHSLQHRPADRSSSCTCGWAAKGATGPSQVTSYLCVQKTTSRYGAFHQVRQLFGVGVELREGWVAAAPQISRAKCFWGYTGTAHQEPLIFSRPPPVNYEELCSVLRFRWSHVSGVYYDLPVNTRRFFSVNHVGCYFALLARRDPLDFAFQAHLSESMRTEVLDLESMKLNRLPASLVIPSIIKHAVFVTGSLIC